MSLPNFFIVGTGKAGTTSLYSYLRQHPEIYMSPVKEPSYFASEIRAEVLSEPMLRHIALQSRELPAVLNDGGTYKPFGWIAGEWEDYARLFHAAGDEKAIGEASAAYLWSSTAAFNIHARLPEAKIIMILRDPAERAFSQYLHQLSVGFTGATFRQHIEACARAGEGNLSATYPFLEIGLYHQQVKRFLDLFPRSQIRIYWYEEAWRDPAKLLADTFRFLNVDDKFQPDLSSHAHQRRAPRFVTLHHLLKSSGFWYPSKALMPAGALSRLRKLAFHAGPSLRMDPADRQYLTDYYRDDIHHLSTLLDRDLTSWL
uniref:Sulfotransferase n=1 Tax=Solibacter usitatus (strain Ellin6076) TaxID=234267 RepID=Q01S16_SOLUE